MTRRPIQPGIRTGREESEGPGERLSEDLREALSRWAAGVTVVTVPRAGAEGGPPRPAPGPPGAAPGITVTSFCPVSLDPPLVLVCLSEHASLLTRLLEAGRFTVNLLAASQTRAANVFADSFAPPEPRIAADEDAAIRGSLAALVCAVHETHAGGDHRIVIGRVERVELGEDGDPLLYHRRRYRRLT